MQKYLLLFLAISLSVAMFSCSKTDTTKPTAELVSPSDADTFLINDTILFQAVFHDNEELNQYQVEMKNNFTEIADSLPAWKFVLVNVLHGTEDTATMGFLVPDTIYNGNYLLIVKCADADGNEASADTAQIVIE